jgi:hypothetical protein
MAATILERALRRSAIAERWRTVTDPVTPADFLRWKRRGYFESVIGHALLLGRATLANHEQETTCAS